MQVLGTSVLTLPPDQVSLQDCPISIQTSYLWGTSNPPVAESVPSNLDPTHLSSSAALTSTEVAPISDHGHNFLLPDNFQHMVDAVVQQSLSARFRASSRGTAVRSFASDCLEDSISDGDPDSPNKSQLTHMSYLGEDEPPEPDLSEDKVFLWKSPPLLDFSVRPYLSPCCSRLSTWLNLVLVP